MVPYFLAHQGVSKDKAAKDLGVTIKQLESDLNLLWYCKLPGREGLEIDIVFDRDTVSVYRSAGLERPLRLTAEEAGALTLALRALSDVKGVVDTTAVESALAKIESAAGVSSSAVPEPVTTGESRAVSNVRAGLRDKRALRLKYYSASRDAVTERTVDPIQPRLIDGQGYLQAWCRQAEDVRLFRFDRIESAEVLDEPSMPKQRPAADEGLELFHGHAELPKATLRIAAGCAWVVDQYPMDVIARDNEGNVTASMSYGTTEWMVRLVLGFGADVTVIEPTALADAVRQRAASALEAYR
ncbi:MAG: YafY family transcriptional regulator [Nocardiaceae bacterium]|nr:YafY family transcriptional regulator [Nocardiaceae bacterium]